MALVETAHAKLNLALHVRRRDADGYHAIETLFAFCADGDGLSFEPGGEGVALEVTGPFAHALRHPGGGGDLVDGGRSTAPDTEMPASAGMTDNLVMKAASAFAARYRPVPGRFTLDKHLPVAAGIGGGSADAAAALRLLARAAGVASDDPGLHAIAASLGADVPACLVSRTMRGQGRGDRLSLEAGPPAGTPVLLVNPNVPLATGQVFAGWDGLDRGPLLDWRAGRNDLEAPARTLRPEIGAVLDRLSGLSGATHARMSGSGATCFALFDDAAARDDAAAALRSTGWWLMATMLLP